MSEDTYRTQLRSDAGPSGYQGYSVTISYRLAKALGWKQGEELELIPKEGEIMVRRVG